MIAPMPGVNNITASLLRERPGCRSLVRRPSRSRSASDYKATMTVIVLVVLISLRMKKWW
jgi:hypothetical protein